MKYYLEINLLKQAEISMYFVWSKVFTQLHLAFVECKDQDDKIPIGISFPDYMFDSEKEFGMLGSKIRLFADDKMALIKLDLSKWLNRLQDYLQLSDIQEVPQNMVKEYAVFSRKQIKSNPERLARRRAKKDPSISFQEALKRYQKSDSTNLPYIQVNSLSSSNSFRLFVERKISETENKGCFSCYGLSNNVTVPIF
jgi:CRISPR-associated endonuclease Csy4